MLVINELSLDNINNRYIGSEPPHIIYADSENIIINCGGVYVYNMSSKSLIKTLDVLSFKDEMDPDTFYDCFATEDGKKIIFTFTKLNLKGASTYYCYSFDSDKLSKINEVDYKKYRENAFENSRNDINDDIDNNTRTGLTYISDTEYIYLLTPEMIIGNIVAVYVKDSVETYYQIFK